MPRARLARKHPFDAPWRAEPAGSSNDGLNRDRIVKVAMEMADADGWESGVSMRRLATRLGSTPMALYWYVADRSELLDLVLDAVEGEVSLPVAGDDWREDLQALFGELRTVLLRHTWLAPLVSTRPNRGPNAVRSIDWALGALRRGGLSVLDAWVAFEVLVRYVVGSVVDEVGPLVDLGRLGMDAEQAADLMRAHLEAESAERFPFYAAALREMRLQPRASAEAEQDAFRRGLSWLLAGLDRN